MAGIFTKRIWQPCICQPNDLKIKKKLGGQSKILMGMVHPGPPLESPLETAKQKKSLYSATVAHMKNITQQ